MKGDTSDSEFRTLVAMLRDHWLGTPFDRYKVKFEYWNRTKPTFTLAMRAPSPIEDLRLGETPTEHCVICDDKSHPKSVYCPRCRQFMRFGQENLARRAALKAAWDPVRRKFICFYTGVELDDAGINDPWLISFDHGTPGKKGDLVVAALWVSLMKIDLARDEFYAVVNELARCFETGDNFDERVCQFLYWKRREDGTRKLKLFPLV